MDNSLYVGLSRQVVLQRAMDMVANNVANVSTPGFRAQNPIFEEYISKPSGAKDSLSMVHDKGQYANVAAGPAQYTGGTYDIALSGPAYINVKTPSGETQYSRAGNLNVNDQGTLVNSVGYEIMGSGGSITIPKTATQVKITDDGTVFADGNSIGKIGMTEFENVNDLVPQGNGLYKANKEGVPAAGTTIKQGMLEGSNVNSVLEMTRMIDISRKYQSSLSMMKGEHERTLNAIQRLAKTTG